MTEDDLPRPKTDVLFALAREDLGRLSDDEVRERISALRAEIARAEARLTESSAIKSAADALFRRG